MSSTGYQRPPSLSDFSSKASDPAAQKDSPDLRLHDPRSASAEHYEDINRSVLPASEIEQTTTPMRPEKTSSNLQNTRSRLGLHPTAPVVHEHDVEGHLDWWWPQVRMSLKEPFAEVLLSTNQQTAPGGDGYGNYQSINWGWGLGVMLGIYVAGDSGAYLNPSITFTNCVLRKLPWRRFPIYFLAQFLGGFCAAGVVYINYINGINAFEGGPGIRSVPPVKTATAGIFCTYPQGDMTKASMFFDEFIASFLLMFVIFALKDDSNKGAFSASGAWFPLGLFFLIFGIGACFGWQTGYAINLVRDFGPRLMSYAVGYGHEVWSAGGYYFWIPMVAPFLGCLAGGIFYDLFIYTGPSPINTPWFGLRDLFEPKQAMEKRLQDQHKEGLV